MLRRLVAMMASAPRPVLFYDDCSPPVRSCLILAKYLKIDVDLRYVNLFKRENLETEFIKLNPAHTVPTLNHGDLILTDSHSILIYLCEKFAMHTDLYPHDDEISRIKIINKLFFEACVLFRRDSDMWADVIRGKNKELDHHRDKVSEVYSMMESFLDETKFMTGEKITIADLSIATTLSTIAILVPLEQDKWPKLVKWLKEMYSFPCFLEVNEPGLLKLKASMQKYLK